MEPKKYEYIDGLRGVAIMLVIINHVNGFMNTNIIYSFFPKFIVELIWDGRLGVQLFFVVSAFTLMLSINSRKNEAHSTRNFFIRRFFRIAPMYYLAIIYFTLSFMNFSFTAEAFGNVPKKGLILSFLFANGLLPSTINSYVPGGWSITVEFMFYFILPFLAGKIRSRNVAAVFVFVAMLISSLFFFILKDTSWQNYHFLDYYFISQLPVFGLGLLAYYCLNNSKDEKLYPVLLCIIAGLFLYKYITLNDGQYYGFIFFFLLLAVSLNPKLLQWKSLAKIGRLSFSLYLVHFIVIDIANRLIYIPFDKYIYNQQTAVLFYIISFAVLLGISLIISHFTHKYIEIQGQNLGRSLIKRLNIRLAV